jgi:hypothetical protein
MRRFSTCCGILLLAAFGLFAGDVSEAQRRIFEAQEAQRQRDLENQVTARYVPGAVVTEACENGDFEAGLAGWNGAYGGVLWGTDEPDLDSLTAGIQQGKLTLSSSRQTVVSVDDGPDPNVGISQVARDGSTHAVRIGNARAGGGVELLEKTFVVSPNRPSIGFQYAVVLEAPFHAPRNETEHLPLFRVRVTDAQGTEIPGVVHLNTGVDGIAERLTAEVGPPFTTVLRKSSSVPIVYLPWTCAFIDLTRYVGQTVTVQFIVEDCSEFGHWGYAYIDDFCNTDCVEVHPTCGSGPNLVRNGDFEEGDSEIGSELLYQPAPGAPGAVLPGEYSIVNGAQAGTISPTWLVNDHESCATGKFLAVNGATGRTGSRRIWSQTISVVPGTAYRFCANLRNLPQCVLDVAPKVEVRFTSSPEVVIPSVIVIDADPSMPCAWKRQSRRIVIPPGVVSVTVEIRLDESGEGDGNDLAIDDLSLKVDAPEVTP